jgi:hypothetical protein
MVCARVSVSGGPYDPIPPGPPRGGFHSQRGKHMAAKKKAAKKAKPKKAAKRKKR